MASTSIHKYPYPTASNVMDSVHIKLSERNYFLWRNLMIGFVERQDLMVFILGTIPAPPQKITIPDDNSASGNKEIENPDYLAWRSSDELVREWIFKTLEEDILFRVMNLKTAKDVWTALEKDLGQPYQYPGGNGTVSNIEAGKKLSHYLPLHKAALAGDWESANKFREQESEAVRAIVTGFSETALMVAVRSPLRNHFVQQLVGLMLPDDLAIKDSSGSTALHTAALVGNIEAAKLLIQKNPNLAIVWNNDKELPLHVAAKYGQGEMVLYLLPITKEDAEPKPFEEESGAKILCDLIDSGLYDIALSFLQHYPKLSSGKPSPVEPSPLESIAREPSAFRSGARLNIFQRLIYSCSPAKLEELPSQNHPGDIENPTICISVKDRVHAVFWRGAAKIVPLIKDVQEKKKKHYQALQLVKCLCSEIVKLDYSKANALLEPPLNLAIRFGIYEVVEEILVSFPSAVYHESEKKQTLFHQAVVHRRENVFNLIHQFESKHIFLSKPDATRNNGLHLAGYLEPQQKFNLRAKAAGAALQAQRELQWFKEVEKYVLPQHRDHENTQRRTPTMAFTETHEELIKEGEQWMKDTANSCTIVAALVATVVFASAITVPGGNNGDSGRPIFYDEMAFIIFGISDAVALFRIHFFCSGVFVHPYFQIRRKRFSLCPTKKANYWSYKSTPFNNNHDGSLHCYHISCFRG
ncbi:Ankyrin repeat family protein [Abeliophyllum distichum]|uniref:Ankyrin repeat family protein n=1 Tax=Abeliophyllum distichum TaxID=126358 RepID=A0ABD1VR19_9LAMI